MTRDPTPVVEERQRDADRSQGTILAAARAEFAEYGLGGARMDRIAERASLNKRLIYYYFADKEALFQAVLELCRSCCPPINSLLVYKKRGLSGTITILER